MKCEDFKNNLYDYHDNILPEESFIEMTAHIDECSDCFKINKRYADFLNNFSSLPKSIEPDRDLWDDIKNKISLDKKNISYTRIKILSIAASFIFVTVFSLALLLNNYNRNYTKEAKILNQFNTASKQYIIAREELVTVLHSKEGVLKKETIEIIENNLIIIDQAINEIKIAIKKEPDNQSLVLMLADTYYKETDLLLSTKDLILNIE